MLTLIDDERSEILEIDDDIDDVLKNQHDKLTFYYGPKDVYAPLEFYNELVAEYPKVKAYLAPEEIAHAFVMAHHVPVAKQVGDWISEVLKFDMQQQENLPQKSE